MSGRTWLRDHFLDHPGLSAKDPAALAPGGKAKLLCKYCYTHLVSTEKQQDQNKLRDGVIQQARSEEIIRRQLYASPAVIQGRGVSMRTHLRNCVHTPLTIRQQAEQEARDVKSGRNISTVAPRMDAGPSHIPAIQTPHPTYASTSISSSSSLQLQTGTLPHYSLHTSTLLEPSSPALSEISLTPSDSISQVGSQPGSDIGLDIPHSLSRGLKRSRSSSHQGFHQIPPWTSAQQAQLEDRLTHITASAGFALSWGENPELLAFFQEFLPQAKVPSRKVLTNRLLPKVTQTYRERAREDARTSGMNVTAQCDGWTGVNQHHLIAFMMTSGRKVRTVRVHDASKERKTADHLLELMTDVIKELEIVWKVNVVAFTTDASGESRKARKMLVRLRPQIVAPDCYAHQVNLIVGDYFKVDQGFLQYSKHATELITWIRSKTYVLALIRNAQLEARQPVVTIIRAVLTRWTSHYLAFRRLLDIHSTLNYLVTKDQMLPESQLITGDTKAKAKAQTMVRLIQNSDFWKALARIKNHLEPLAIAANITQSAFCRLDQVLLTFGALFHHFDGLHNPVDKTVRIAVLRSLETRWHKSDQEVFITAVLLNPFIHSPFSPQLPYFNRAGLLTLLTCLYNRFFGSEDVAVDIFHNLNDYYNSQGVFSGVKQLQAVLIDSAIKQKSSPDPVEFWQSLVTGIPGPLIRLALHIFSICANSASCGRLFSTFGNILTKLRNRLGTKTLTMLAELKMHVRDEQLAAQTAKHHLKRHFGQARDEGNEVVQTSATQQPSQPQNPVAGASSHSDDPDLEVEDEFQELTSSLTAMANDDEISDNLEFPSELSIPLGSLFDFTSKSWVDIHNISAVRSLDEELEFYELVDADGNWGAGIDVAVDEALNCLL